MHSIYWYTDIYQGLKICANSCIYICIYVCVCVCITLLESLRDRESYMQILFSKVQVPLLFSPRFVFDSLCSFLDLLCSDFWMKLQYDWSSKWIQQRPWPCTWLWIRKVCRGSCFEGEASMSKESRLSSLDQSLQLFQEWQWELQ